MELVPKVLVVEDEAIPALLLSRFLRSLGFAEVDCESTGRGAVRRAEAMRYGLVFMDIGLADELDGIDAARAILAIQVPRLFFMTGYADEDMEARARALGPERYFIKPLDLERIRQAVLAGPAGG
ncbi:MAG: response regulator [Spirochaetota bacterium]